MFSSKSWWAVTGRSFQAIVASTTVSTSEVDTVINSYSAVRAGKANWTRTGITNSKTVACCTIVAGVGVTRIDLSFAFLSRKARKAAAGEHSGSLDTGTIVETRMIGARIDGEFTLSSGKLWPGKIEIKPFHLVEMSLGDNKTLWIDLNCSQV